MASRDVRRITESQFYIGITIQFTGFNRPGSEGSEADSAELVATRN